MEDRYVYYEQIDAWVDTDTGEVVAENNLAYIRYHIDNDAEAENYLRRRMHCESQIQSIEYQERQILENLNSIKVLWKKKLQWLDKTYQPLLEHFAKGKLEGKKSKTLQFAHGSISFRVVPSAIKVREEKKEDILKWCKQVCPEAVKVTFSESILLTPLKKAISENNLLMREDLFELVPEHESVKIKGLGRGEE